MENIMFAKFYIATIILLMLLFSNYGYCVDEKSSDERSIDCYTMNASRISYNKGNNEMPCFSPDGKKLAYVRSARDKSELWIINLETHREKAASIAQPESESNFDLGAVGNKASFSMSISWAPDSRFYVYVGESYHLYIGCVDMDMSFQLTSASATDKDPRWSPDGRFIVFTSSRSGNGDLYLIKIKDLMDNMIKTQQYDLFSKIENTPNNYLSLITPKSDGIDYAPNWSPDSEYIIFHSYSSSPLQPDSETINIKAIHLIKDRDGLVKTWETKMITHWFDPVPYTEMHPSWSPFYGVSKKEYIAFYSDMLDGKVTKQEYMERQKTSEKQFAIFVCELSREELDKKIALDQEGEAKSKVYLLLPYKVITPKDFRANYDVNYGPAWLPDNKNNKGIILSRTDEKEKNQLYYLKIRDEYNNGKKNLLDLDLTNDLFKLKTKTYMNSNVCVCNDGVKIAYTALEYTNRSLYIGVIRWSSKKGKT
jgi:dipeptidyl aminopeptidase/acylaminoacyl peptidase